MPDARVFEGDAEALTEHLAEFPVNRRTSFAAMAVAAAGFASGRAVAGPGLKIENLAQPQPPASPAEDGKRNFVLADEDFGVEPGRSATANSRQLQRAVNEGRVVLLPSAEEAIELAEPVTIPPGTQIVGAGTSHSLIRALGSHGFIYQAANGTAFLEGPKLADFTLECAESGLALNSPRGGFTDDATTQNYIGRPKLERMCLRGPGADRTQSIGVDWNLVFSGVIDQCEIAGFGIGVKALGCDFTALVNRTRVWNCGTLIQADRAGYFGSGLLIDGADLLIPLHCFVRSSDHHATIRGSYFEMHPGAPLTGPVLDIAHNYATIITGNRFETPSAICPTFLRVAGEGCLFAFSENAIRGPSWGRVDWNGDNSARYMWNAMLRQKICVRNNSYEISVPFRSVDDNLARNERRDLWALSPGTAGFFSSYNYAENCRVRDGAFVLPAAADNGSLVRFKDENRRVSGVVNIFVQARSDHPGTTIGVRPFSGNTPSSATALRLDHDYAWHIAGERVSCDDLAIDIFNRDVASGGNAHVKSVVVERAFI